MKKINEMSDIKSTLSKPNSVQSKNFDNNFKKTMTRTAPNVKLKENNIMNEVDSVLTEAEQSIKKKIFSLPKMEALVFSDPKLSSVYDQMSINGETRFGYHYNETIMNIIFNDYVLNSQKYLQKYKMSIPKKKKRRDKSGINQLKRSGEDKMMATGKPEIDETTSSGGGMAGGGGANQSGSGAYVGPAAWSKKGDLLGNKGKPINKPIWPGGTMIQENTNYLIDSSYFEKYVEFLNEADLSYQTKLGKQYQQSHSNSNNGLGVSELPQATNITDLKKGIDDNTALYVGQDVDKMRDNDVKILHNDMTKRNTMFPHPKNPNLQSDGISGNGNEDKKIYINKKDREDNYIIDKTNAFSSDMVKHWDKNDINIELSTLKTGRMDNPNLNLMEDNVIGEVKSKSFGMAHTIQKDKLSPNNVGNTVNNIVKTVNNKNVDDIAITKHKKLPVKVDETEESMIAKSSTGSISNTSTATDQQGGKVPTGTDQVGGMNEAIKLLKEINDELNAYSIHHQKLIKMSENRKIPSEIVRDRVIAQNPTNFKKDLQNSDTKKVIDVEKELMWKDQQTNVDNPQELSDDIEKNELKIAGKDSQGLKNVGNSTNDNGKEIPKRNFTSKEQDEVNMYRLGQHSLVYDNKPDNRFEDRMKKDMGDDIYNMRQKQLDFRGKAPMYNKDPQPVENTTAKKVQFDKEQTGWNEREGLKESMITGRYIDTLGKRHLIDFKVNDAIISENSENLFKLDFTGLGNTYNSKTVDNKVIVNEAVVNIIKKYDFYTDGKSVIRIKNFTQNLNENNSATKPIINEEMNKMKHLLKYNPETFTTTKNIKNNRGF